MKTTAEAHTLSKDDPAGERWTLAKRQADVVSAAYRRDSNPKIRAWGEKVGACAQRLLYAYDPEQGGGYRRQLVEARLCRVRTCPICAWRRAEKLAAEIGKVVEQKTRGGELVALMLTLTVQNCTVSELHETIKKMFHGWAKLRKRKFFKEMVVGWTRSLEITRGRKHIKDDAHPHLHCILLAEPEEAAALCMMSWGQIWQDVMQLQYWPQTDIMPLDAHGVSEAVKYTVKPHELTANAVSGWLGRVALSIDGVRAFAASENLRLREPDDKMQEIEEERGEHVENPPEGVAVLSKKRPFTILYHWSGSAYMRGLVSHGQGAAEVRALQVAWARGGGWGG